LIAQYNEAIETIHTALPLLTGEQREDMEMSLVRLYIAVENYELDIRVLEFTRERSRMDAKILVKACLAVENYEATQQLSFEHTYRSTANMFIGPSI
jgi:hypothetical protein